ncbi:hypothetical protein R69608_05546 [Paraburkholderia nemoris]|uniref:hypothetical protein n=1 Tax=Paraburkholderia nemoris TaxID=2793076 RepID=UPI0019133FFB|nr:hypothetical protein [Paraburkholderia nemoris]MBK5150564.1 hypothetical protein [Burkholderia sp. R-69608]CAE6946402.1 hypothetical protein R69608_05546 [Paraburkholderia nemoris]
MTALPPPDLRAKLDEYIKTLTRLGDGLTINDFRDDAIADAKRTSKRVRAFVCIGSVVFLLLMVLELAIPLFIAIPVHRFGVLLVVVWAFALGGLGAIANTFLHLLRLVPQQTLNTADFFEVIGRTFLGCLFSTVLTLTLFPETRGFLESLSIDVPDAKKTSGIVALAPFLLGYSIPLVLRLLDKVIQAVELTVGADDRRSAANPARASRPSGRRR